MMSLLEAFWILLSVLGGGFSVSNMQGAWCDYQEAQDAKSNRLGRVMIAVWMFSAESAFTFAHFIFFLLGVISSATPPPSDDIGIAGYIMQALFFLLQFAFIAVGALGYQTRKHLSTERARNAAKRVPDKEP